eukprot:TRINITY_DN2690_c0_g1_i7.p1 TRINITY_DN2690_c0_g1~~TRINITY_DN2690_c0_g1_i7.p1  ORF type:complete len:299 (-),score=19.48 TRINITY_DN2690_c0_g1_i7:7-903(-)
MSGVGYTAPCSLLSIYCCFVLLFNVYGISMMFWNETYAFNVGTICIFIEFIAQIIRLACIILNLYGYSSNMLYNVLFTSHILFATITSTLVVVFWQDMTTKISTKIYTFLTPRSSKILTSLAFGLIIVEIVNNVVFSYYPDYEFRYRLGIYSGVAVVVSTYYFFVSYRVIKQLSMLSISNKRKLRAKRMVVKIITCGVCLYNCTFAGLLIVVFGGYHPAVWVLGIFLGFFAIISLSFTKLLLFTNSRSKGSKSENSTKQKDSENYTNDTNAQEAVSEASVNTSINSDPSEGKRELLEV